MDAVDMQLRNLFINGVDYGEIQQEKVLFDFPNNRIIIDGVYFKFGDNGFTATLHEVNGDDRSDINIGLPRIACEIVAMSANPELPTICQCRL